MNQVETTSLENLHHVKETETFTKTQDEEGRSVINEYTFIKKLGEGAYGKVKLAIQMDSLKKYAVKVIKKDLLKRRREMIRDERGRVKYKDAFEDVLREIAIMKKLNHSNLVKLNEVINNPDADKMYMVMDFAEKGQLIEFNDDDRVFFSLSGKASIDEEELRNIFAQTIKGIQYLHVNGIVHRDLKPQNILQAEDGTIKIADFGLANIFGESDTLKKVEGTHHFMSPESLLSDQNGYSGKIADIWALGVSFFAYTFYKPPFDGEDLVELFDNIKTQELVFPEERQISSELKDFLSQLLDKDPTKRITLEQLENHAWFQASENKEAFMSNLQAKPEEVTVTKEEIQNAITSFEKVIFMKKLCKRMITNFRRISALSQNSRSATLIKEVLENVTSSVDISSNGTLVLQPGQKQSSIVEGMFEGGLGKDAQSVNTLIKDSEPLQLPEGLDKEASDEKSPEVETLTEQVQALVLEQNQSSTESESQVEQPTNNETLNLDSLLKKALLLQPGQNQSSTAENSVGVSVDKESLNFEGLIKETQLVENTQNQNLIASE